ncbi:Magnesium transporter MRS2-I [Vitis vinifera]|uniref:Magnesium transporter n=1 Tax=Vitis vinifera TaxID=29760 RepID=A0A438KL60_VITVI|nr:Magnesium transporter MRS2-I [Vitis vinifera]
MLPPERQIPPWGHTNTTTEKGKEYKDVNNPNNPSSSNHPQQCSPKGFGYGCGSSLKFSSAEKRYESFYWGGRWKKLGDLFNGGDEWISSLNLDRVRKLKSAMTRLTARVQKVCLSSKGVITSSMVRDELEQLLDDDDDMADLYLSRKLAGASSPVSGSGAPNWFAASPTIGSKISRVSRASVATVRGDENDVEELEMLLEAYFMQIDGTLNKLTTLREYIDDTEDYINIQLDNHRNQLIQLELFLSSGTVCLSIYSLVAGIFGMNIPYTWNDDHGFMFKWVVIVTGVSCALLFVVIMSYARHKGLVGS